MHDTNQQHETRSVLAILCGLIPPRTVRFSEALCVAEIQANRLLELTAVSDGPVPNEVISELPRVRITYRDIPTSGMSYWDGQVWIIALNRSEPHARQRFTLFHEYKHIIDHGRASQLYGSDEQAEQAADFFAGCALMPKTFLKRAWAGELVQRPIVLAQLFDVSARAVSVRLAQIGLSEPVDRCQTRSARSPHRSGRYFRQLSNSWPSSVSGIATKTSEVLYV